MVWQSFSTRKEQLVAASMARRAEVRFKSGVMRMWAAVFVHCEGEERITVTGQAMHLPPLEATTGLPHGHGMCQYVALTIYANAHLRNYVLLSFAPTQVWVAPHVSW